MLIATGEPPREVTLLPDKNGSTLKSLQALVGGNIETFDIAFGEEVSLYVNEEGLFTCPPNRAIFATEEMAKAGYHSGRLRHFRGEPRLHLRQERARGGCACKGCARKG